MLMKGDTLLSLQPWDNDVAADFFTELFKTTNLSQSISDLLVEEVKSISQAQKVRAAIFVLITLGRDVWPIDELDELLPDAISRLREIKALQMDEKTSASLSLELELLEMRSRIELYETQDPLYLDLLHRWFEFDKRKNHMLPACLNTIEEPPIQFDCEKKGIGVDFVSVTRLFKKMKRGTKFAFLWASKDRSSFYDLDGKMGKKGEVLKGECGFGKVPNMILREKTLYLQEGFEEGVPSAAVLHISTSEDSKNNFSLFSEQLTSALFLSGNLEKMTVDADAKLLKCWVFDSKLATESLALEFGNSFVLEKIEALL